MSRLKKKTSLAAMIVSFGALVLLYQNCSPNPSTEFASSQPTPSSSTSTIVAAPPTSSYSGGNGGGYDGKPYVLPDLTQACSDGDGAKSRILEKTGTYTLVRSNCVNLAVPQTVTATVLPAVAPNVDSIVYGDKVFDSQAGLVAGTQLPTKTYCRQGSQTATITVPQTVGTNFGVELVVSVSNSDLVASLFFDDNSTSDAYITSNLKVGAATTAPLAGPYAYNFGSQNMSLTFSSGAVQVQAANLPVTDTNTASVTGTLVNYNSSLATCWSN